MNTLICIAAGPSLMRRDVAMCERAGLPIMVVNGAFMFAESIVVNGAFRFAESPEYHYAGDTRWWLRNYDQAQLWSQKFSIRADKYDQGFPGVRQMDRGTTEGFSTTWPVISTGKNSGYAAINLAYLLGFRRLILLGYDMKFTSDGKKHCHPDHPDSNPSEDTVDEWLRIFHKMAPEMKELGLDILNATRDTALECFPLVRLEEVI